ncbi:chitosanase [Corallococcus sp. Z5C101001]|uniref:chitosanase n=1 Tax=Corallococcus sp. Z5C101001 TaxID=2596829 RepID=UPI00117F1E79|nr:chitosanase [Corallococcus sp. Z5C101001]TSC25026.1 chitosanase [Corallococcus sp. Z5C101001]
METRCSRTWVLGQRGCAGVGLLMLALGCGAAEEREFPPEAPGEVVRELGACTHAVTTNTYVGPDYWGTLVFKNTGTVAIANPRVSLDVPSGVTCDDDQPGWAHTQSGRTCTFTRTSSLTVAVNASYTFNYSTDSGTSFTATHVKVQSDSCGGTAPGGTGLTANQKKVAEALTSIWENDTPTLDYAYSENIHDGRGYTNGRAGFCTGTGDAIQVVQCYRALRTEANGNRLSKYWSALTVINNRFLSTGQSQASTAELDAVGGWTTDWAASFNTAATKADFKQCQDQVSDALYYTPIMNEAAKWGLTQALTKAALYDAAINHGEDGARDLIRKANTALGNSAQVAPVIGYNGITESAWLQKFLEKRRDVLAGDSTWADAVDRVAAYEKQRRLGNWDLGTALRNDVRARDCWGTTYPSSGYTVRAINPDGTWSTPASFTYACQ